jgi:hypothetical protein
MTRIFCGTALLGALVLGAGCAMCDSSCDDAYPAYGGICADGACGARAGSIISPAGGEIIEGMTVVEDAQTVESTPPTLEPVPAPPLEQEPPPPLEEELGPPLEEEPAPPLDTEPAEPLDLEPAEPLDLESAEPLGAEATEPA